MKCCSVLSSKIESSSLLWSRERGADPSPRLDSRIVRGRLVNKTGKTGVIIPGTRSHLTDPPLVGSGRLRQNRQNRRYLLLEDLSPVSAEASSHVRVVGPLRQNRQNTQNLRPTSLSHAALG